MRSTSILMLSCVLAFGAVTAGNSAEPPAASNETPLPADAAAPTSESATAAIASPAEPTEAELVESESMKRAEFERVSKQYRKVEKDGQTLYCRNEKRLGTRLPSPVCLTDAQLWDRINKAEEVRNEMRKTKAGPCQPQMTC